MRLDRHALHERRLGTRPVASEKGQPRVRDSYLPTPDVDPYEVGNWCCDTLEQPSIPGQGVRAARRTCPAPDSKASMAALHETAWHVRLAKGNDRPVLGGPGLTAA